MADRPLGTDPQDAKEPLTILGWPYQPDGSGYYRFWLPYEHLARFTPHRIGIPDVAVPYNGPSDEDVDVCDVVAGQRWMFPNAVKLLRRWRDRTKLVYEVDDDILHPDSSSGLAHLYESGVQDSIRECLRLAHLVTVSTEPLA